MKEGGGGERVRDRGGERGTEGRRRGRERDRRRERGRERVRENLTGHSFMPYINILTISSLITHNSAST